MPPVLPSAVEVHDLKVLQAAALVLDALWPPNYILPDKIYHSATVIRNPLVKGYASGFVYARPGTTIRI